ncbi:hypothetical protein AB0L59_42010 [Streptomyces sp. NPDC052109]|uniref:hypothetical protein n=1 Tax=Streptomyces sp. NPDC052109 TaxID=3155527 RepID=UPI0034268C9F
MFAGYGLKRRMHADRIALKLTTVLDNDFWLVHGRLIRGNRFAGASASIPRESSKIQPVPSSDRGTEDLRDRIS